MRNQPAPPTATKAMVRWVIRDNATGRYVNEDVATGYVDDVFLATFFKSKGEVVKNIRENENTGKETPVRVALYVSP